MTETGISYNQYSQFLPEVTLAVKLYMESSNPDSKATELMASQSCNWSSTAGILAYLVVREKSGLVPADLVGTRIYNQKTSEFSTSLGPVFTNLLLADEINRASPRTQSALLEAMNESQVSVDGKPVPIRPATSSGRIVLARRAANYQLIRGRIRADAVVNNSR
jgi:hypothetical protein